MSKPQTFQPGDGITGRCEICQVEVREPLPAGEPYDRAVADRAVKKVTEWAEAHYAEFHPDKRDPFTMEAHLGDAA